MIDGTSQLLSTIAGTGATAYAGEWVPATGAQMSNPHVFRYGTHLIVTDDSNPVVRMIY